MHENFPIHGSALASHRLNNFITHIKNISQVYFSKESMEAEKQLKPLKTKTL